MELSRRKQLRPARMDTVTAATTPQAADDVSQSSGDDDDNASLIEVDNSKSTTPHDDAEPPYSVGEIIGPIRVRRLASPLEAIKGAIATLLDSTGNAMFFEVDEDEKILTAVRPTASIDDANCVVMLIGPDSVRIVMVKPASKTDTLTALFIPSSGPSPSSSLNGEKAPTDPPKKYLCDMCCMVSFNSLDNLKAHQTSYCTKAKSTTEPVTPSPATVVRPVVASSPIVPPILNAALPPPVSLTQTLSALANLPTVIQPPAAAPANQSNVIYLPLAYHNHQLGHLMQLLGPPQTVIPIAIPRPILGVTPSLPLSSSLLVNPLLCGLVPIPAALQFTSGDVTTNIPVATGGPSALDPSVGIPSLSPHSTPPSSDQTAKQSLGKRSSMTSPLDLSRKRRRRDDSEKSETKPSSSTEPDASQLTKTPPRRLTPNSPTTNPRPFVCACGIAFSAESTLQAHQSLYCRMAPRTEENTQSKEARKVPSQCSHCDFTPTSASQLAVHVRNNHAEAYVCKECGYRGYSVRGIRAHLRTHPQLDVVKFDELLGSYVTKIATANLSSSGPIVIPTARSENGEESD